MYVWIAYSFYLYCALFLGWPPMAVIKSSIYDFHSNLEHPECRVQGYFSRLEIEKFGTDLIKVQATIHTYHRANIHEIEGGE